jgi:hypothetical protein
MPAISLLAPVPLEHLRSGVDLLNRQRNTRERKVAFGSMAWEVFRELDAERNGAPVDVFIYASGDPSAERVEVSWRGRYIGHVESENGAHPNGMQFRPASTEKYPSDNKGHWAVFWEVDQLRELSASERLRVSEFESWAGTKPCKSNFIPRGPLLVISPPKNSGRSEAESPQGTVTRSLP